MSRPPGERHPRRLSAKLRSIDEEIRSALDELEIQENEPGTQIRLEAVMKRYRNGNKTIRRIHISERFNEKSDIEKYDKATEKGGRYCIVTIRWLPGKILESRK